MARPKKTEHAERTTVSLPPDLARRLNYEAQVEQRSASSVVRDALETYFSRVEEDPLPAFTAIAEGPDENGSRRGDEIIGEYLDGRFTRKMGRDR